jgi:hypothetical protein
MRNRTSGRSTRTTTSAQKKRLETSRWSCPSTTIRPLARFGWRGRRARLSAPAPREPRATGFARSIGTCSGPCECVQRSAARPRLNSVLNGHLVAGPRSAISCVRGTNSRSRVRFGRSNRRRRGGAEADGRRVVSASVAGDPDGGVLSLVVSSSDDHGVFDSGLACPACDARGRPENTGPDARDLAVQPRRRACDPSILLRSGLAVPGRMDGRDVFAILSKVKYCCLHR